jgi:phosphoribosylglycinamide formyltransferase-1
VINVHPALLPKFGGKGMYGIHVHNAVVNQKETETGITIHYVNEHYDEGAIIFQAKCEVKTSDSAETVAAKIHELEMEHFPKVVDRLLKE